MFTLLGTVLRNPEWVTAWGIGAIALASIIIAGVAIFVGWCIWEWRKESTERGKKRIEIAEKITHIIIPLINQFEKETNLLEKMEYNWDYKNKRIEAFNKIEYMELKNEFPNIWRIVDEHNEIYKLLEDKMKELHEAIYTHDFRKKCTKLIEEWNESKAKENMIDESNIECFVGYIIDNKKELEDKVYNEFWKVKGKEILKIMEKKEVKEKMEEVMKISEELKKRSKACVTELKKLRERWILEYELPQNF